MYFYFGYPFVYFLFLLVGAEKGRGWQGKKQNRYQDKKGLNKYGSHGISSPIRFIFQVLWLVAYGMVTHLF